MAGAGAVRIAPGVVVPVEELEWRFSTAGGPGGQHVNTANVRAEVRFRVAESPSLPDDVRQRLVARLGPVVRVVAGERRSQAQNRRLALERLEDRLRAALTVDVERRATRPTRASRRRRLDAKRQRAERKRDRSARWDDT